MKSYVQYVKDKLMESIQTLGTLKNMYIEREGKDFIRNRKLNFSATVDVCRQFLLDHSTLSPPNVEALLLKYVQPVRNGRHDPRKVKPRSFVSFTYRVA